MSYVILALATMLFAINMGGANFSVSFAPAYGSGVISVRKAQLLFILFVFLGAITIGGPVAKTLGSGILPHGFLKLDMVNIIVCSAALSLFVANRLNVPQSTSLVTVSAICGVGAYFSNINFSIFPRLIFFWTLLPVAGYFITYFLGKIIYPPRKSNFWIYERFINHQGKLKWFVLIASCYSAYSCGANNVANAAGPIMGAGIIGLIPAIILISPIFGAGSMFFTGTLTAAGSKIVPLGVFTATLICFVTATLIVIASLFGVPQSFVMLKMGSIFAIGGLKDGHKATFLNPFTRTTYITWAVTPFIAFFMAFSLTWGKYAFIK